MKTENRRQTVQATPACWQREAPCPCLRIETSPNESHVFPYQHLVTASLTSAEQIETLRLSFSSHDVELQGRNLRALLLALQDFALWAGDRVAAVDINPLILGNGRAVAVDALVLPAGLD